MAEKVLFDMPAPLRENFDIPYHDIGPQEQAPRAAFVAGLHGNELNGVFVLARLADLLRQAESGESKGYRLRKRVVVVPAVNVFGVNTGSREWPFDKTDINRMFPGHSEGETTQRIAYAVITATMNAHYRVDIHSSNLDFEELPQVRLYEPNEDERSNAFKFGLPAIVERPINKIFTSTIGHAWRWHGGENFVIQAGLAGNLQLIHCDRLFQSLVRFLIHLEILEGKPPETDETTHLYGLEETFPIISDCAGLFVSHMPVGRWVLAGETLGYLYDAFQGRVLEEIKTPVAGQVSGLRRQPLLYEGDLVARIQTRQPSKESVDTYLHGHGQ